MNYKLISSLSEAQVEVTAKIIHENYVENQLQQLRSADNLKVWDKLSDSLKNSNISQATFMTEELRKVGFGIQKLTNSGIGIKTFSKKQIDMMARLEHGRFVAERISEGWKFGPEKDVEKKISPYLVEWDELTKEVQQYDIDAIENFPTLLAEAGFEIYKQ